MKLISRIAAAALLILVTGPAACGEGPADVRGPGASGTGASTAADGRGDWPQFRGPTGMGFSSEKTPIQWSPTDNIVWKIEMPGAGTSSPIVFGDRIYITCYTGYNVPGAGRGEQENLKRHLIALHRKDGSQIWSTPTDADLPEQEKIRDDHGYASSTPAADASGIYVFYGKTGALKFDHAGKQIWKTPLGDNLHGWGSASSPVLVGDLVIINAGVESESLVALDKTTGKEKWRVRGVKESWNTPILVDVKNPKDGVKTELVFAVMGKVLGIDPATGKELWSAKTDIGWYMVPSLVAEDGVVYVLGGRSGVAGLAVRTGGRGEVTGSHRLWTSNNGSNVTSPVIKDGYLYWMHDNLGIAYCAKAETGEVMYKEKIDRVGQVYASPILAGGNVYYTSRSGKTIVVAAKPEFEKLATNELGDRSTFNSSPAVADGRILLRSDKYLYCLGE